MSRLVIEVQEPWFTLIADGRKTVEGRTGPPGKYTAGTIVELLGPAGARLVADVVAVRHHPDLATYLAVEGWARTAPHAGSAAAAAAAYAGVVMDNPSVRVFAPERVAARGGINALELAGVRRP